MLRIRVNRLIMGDGGVGTRACTLRYAVWFDVTWCDVVDPRRAPRDTCLLCRACRTVIPSWPRSVPRREARTAEQPPRNHRLCTAGFGRGPQAPRAHRASQDRAPRNARRRFRRREAAHRLPIGCGDPPPRASIQAAARGPRQLVSEPRQSREPSSARRREEWIKRRGIRGRKSVV